MHKTAVFIDGREGTTGLRIEQRLLGRTDLELLVIHPDKRKDREERRRFLNEADIVFLCLPDDAAREAVSLVVNPDTRIIDASTAHRVNSDWAYGLPELNQEYRRKIAFGTRVANPGCHATGFLLSAAPVVKSGLAAADDPFVCHALTGFSGGGKKMIAQYGAPTLPYGFESPRQYAMTGAHKHLPEMQLHAGLAFPPVFTPIVSNYYAGMVTTLSLTNRSLAGNPSTADIHDLFLRTYGDQELVRVMPLSWEDEAFPGYMDASALAGKDYLELHVTGNDMQTLVICRFDNLGKGASGAAVQSMNLMLGLPETTGLSL